MTIPSIRYGLSRADHICVLCRATRRTVEGFQGHVCRLRLVRTHMLRSMCLHFARRFGFSRQVKCCRSIEIRISLQVDELARDDSLIYYLYMLVISFFKPLYDTWGPNVSMTRGPMGHYGTISSPGFCDEVMTPNPAC